MSHFADRKMIGILFACVSYGMYSLHYATMKWLGGDYSVWQLMFIRSLEMFLITLALGRRATIRAFVASPYKATTAVRGVLQFLSGLCFYVAAQSMPLADVTTIYSAAPLIIVILSIFVLGEKIHGFRWIAVMLGLAGTIIAANPGGETNLVPALMAFGSGVFWALTVVFTRKSGARESSSVQMFTTGIVFILLSAAFMRWQTPNSSWDWGLMVVLGLEIYLAQYFFFEACRFAPASLVGPMEYSSVAWACLLGFVIFADVPTMNVIIGAVLVVVGGVALAISTRTSNRKTSAGMVEPVATAAIAE
jgi:S-adenosylmethionine uptake transporter